MNSRQGICLLFFSIFSLSFLLSSCSKKSELTKLKVFVHEPFISSISYEFEEKIRNFEERYQSKIEWISYGSSPLPLLEKMKGDCEMTVDLVYGMDNTNLLDFKESRQFLVYESKELKNLIEELKLDKDYIFTPINYGWLAFEYSEQLWKESLPESIEDLCKKEFKNTYILINPRLNGVGFLFVLWLDACQYNVSQVFPKLVKNAFSLAPDWSAAYALYTLDEAPFVLTYSSSPAYHQIIEGDCSQKTVLDKKNGYLQVEFMAIAKRSGKKELAKKFLDYMLSEEIQKTLPEKVWVFPARKNVALPPAFEKIERPKKLLSHSPEEIHKLKKIWYQCDWF